MSRLKAMTKDEIYRQMDRFQADDKSPFSWAMLGELTGIDMSHLRKVFIYRTAPMTEQTQIRVSRALERMAKGEVTVMRKKDGSRFIRFNQKPEPRIARGYKIRLIDGKLGVAPGLVNKNDYSEITLKEQLED